MQLQSTLSRLAAFALFLLSFSMLACAAPAPVAALAAPGSLAVCDNSLVARGDATQKCHQALLDLNLNLNVNINLLNKCNPDKGCDCKPIIASIVAKIKVVAELFLSLKGKDTIDVTLVLTVWVNLIVKILLKICLAVKPFVIKLGVDICINLSTVLTLLIQAILGLCVSVVIRVSLEAALKVAFLLHLDLFALVGLKPVLALVGIAV